jgi:signal transduction histidine kinase
MNPGPLRVTIDGVSMVDGPSGGAARPASRRVPLRRHRSGRIVAGVCGGIAEHLEVPPGRVRLWLTVLTALSGAGVLVYGLAWIFIPQETLDTDREIPPRERRQALGLAAIGLGVLIAASAIGDSLFGWIAGPIGVVIIGVALVWREADETRRRRWAAASRSGFLGAGGKWAMARIVLGVVLVTGGLVLLFAGQISVSQLSTAILAMVVTLGGTAVLTVPFWVRLTRELGEERRERIRGAERAEIAAHLHDSVLQTLALIQRQADKPREVLRLARGQERELRTWLYGPNGYGHAGRGDADDAALDRTLTSALTAATAEVEDTYAVVMRPVFVGDCAMDDRLATLLSSTREAMINAAKHAQVGEVSVYAEVEPAEVHVFIRDRGIGFDPDDIPEDRHGLADSVHGRMRRHGGEASVRSTPGEGTEVHLRMPRSIEVTRAEEVS